jgi:hypothetical protein
MSISFETFSVVQSETRGSGRGVTTVELEAVAVVVGAKVKVSPKIKAEERGYTCRARRDPGDFNALSIR